MSVFRLGAPVAPFALGYNELSTATNIQHVENPRRGRTDRGDNASNIASSIGIFVLFAGVRLPLQFTAD